MHPPASKPSEDEGAQPPAKPKLDIAVLRRRQPRGDVGGAAAVSNTLTRLAVVLLSSVNAVMWEVYTQAPLMASLWAAIAISFVGWMIYERQR